MAKALNNSFIKRLTEQPAPAETAIEQPTEQTPAPAENEKNSLNATVKTEQPAPAETATEQPAEKKQKAPEKKKAGRPRKYNNADKGKGAGLPDTETRRTFIIEKDVLKALEQLRAITKQTQKEILRDCVYYYLDNFNIDEYQKKQTEELKKALKGVKRK